MAATLAFTATASISLSTGFKAGDWLICGLDGWEEGVVIVGFVVVEVLGVLNAPVEDRWRRSNSSCSLGGRRGGAGPVAKAVLQVVVLMNRRQGRRKRGGKSRDIFVNINLY